MALLGNIDTKQYFQVVLISFLAIEVASWVLAAISDTPILKGGPILFLFLVSILLVTLYSTGKNLDTIRWGREGVFILLVIVGVSVLFFALPKLIPEIFSSVGISLSESIENAAGSIINFGSGIIR